MRKAILLAAFLLLLPAGARAASSPTPEKLVAEIGRRVTRVPEFQFLRQACQELRVRCWLFGGTAAGYGHYVKWDLLREGGDPRYQPDRFDYDYTNIFRSTQDADIVMDGSPALAEQLEQRLKERFPHFQGSKTVWEVRLLGEARGDKEPLLANPDFLNQHTDSNSTGMIEVTPPRQGESPVRDLRDWTPRGRQPQFLKDIHEGKLHYYFSPLHETTARAKRGLNPPILSAARYLTKAFQYELEIRPEDWEEIRRITDAFDPKRDLSDPYVSQWIEKNGKKIFQHAVNLEYAWNKLEELGLRQKLVAAGNKRKVDSLAWWMDKEPLRSRPLGTGPGQTARQLNLDIVAHETNNFLAYESITRAHTGDPNVLISRASAAGEAAVSGDGFYTAVGRKGARNTGLTIRFKVHPDAREGEDFIRVVRTRAGTGSKDGSYIIFRNRNALQVIPEIPRLGLVSYFRMLTSKKGLDPTDKGLFEKFRRRMQVQMLELSQAEKKEILGFVRPWITNAMDRRNPREASFAIMGEYLAHPSLVSHPDAPARYLAIVKAMGKKIDDPGKFPALGSLMESEAFLEKLLVQDEHGPRHVLGAMNLPFWKKHPARIAWLERLFADPRNRELFVDLVLSKPEWAAHPKGQEWLAKLLAEKQDVLALEVLKSPEWVQDRRFPATLRRVLKSGTGWWGPVEALHWVERPDVHALLDLLEKQGSYAAKRDVMRALAHPALAGRPDMFRHLEKLLQDPQLVPEIIREVFSSPAWRRHPGAGKLVLEAFENPENLKLHNLLSETIRHILQDSEWMKEAEYGEIFLKVLRNVRDRGEQARPVLRQLEEVVLQRPGWEKLPEAEEILKALWQTDSTLALKAITQPQWVGKPYVERMIDKGIPDKVDVYRLRELFLVPGRLELPFTGERLRRIVQQAPTHRSFVLKVLGSEGAARQDWAPELIEELLEMGSYPPKAMEGVLAEDVLSQPHWAEKDVAKRWLREITAESFPRLEEGVLQHVLSQPFWSREPEAREAFDRIIRRLPARYDRPAQGVAIAAGAAFARTPAYAEVPEAIDWIAAALKADSGFFDSRLGDGLSHPAWASRSDSGRIAELILNQRTPARVDLLTGMLRSETWSRHELGPALMTAYVQRAKGDGAELLKLPHWQNHPRLRALCEGPVTAACLRKAGAAGLAQLRSPEAVGCVVSRELIKITR